MSDYKSTIHLPKTEFAMKAKLAQREPKQLEVWQKSQLYQNIQKSSGSRPKFNLLDGPPYANGPIHVGHAGNKVLKDMVVKSKRLSGFDAPFVPTWDCHGLPIELAVEKKVGKVGQKIDAKSFRAACAQYAHKQVEGQKKDFERLGVLADWSNPSLTMHNTYEADIIRTLAQIVERNHLSQGFKPVHWCLECRSSLAEAEVEYQDKQSPAIDVLFPCHDSGKVRSLFSDHSDERPIAAVIWTTTPWTLPANQAVCVGQDIHYALVRIEGSYDLILSTDLVQSVLDRAEHTDYKVLGTVSGQALENVSLNHPFYERQVPILVGGHVTTDAGTGLVHTAPSHGEDDFAVCQAHGIEPLNPVGADGVFKQDVPLVGGQFVRKASPQVIEILEQHGHLLHRHDLVHSYPHCWRHKTPLIYRATSQWFISMTQNGLRESALEAVDQVEWIPKISKTRISSMLDNRPDWCISRQRTWGVPIPLFTHIQTGELHPRTVELMYQVADRVAEHGLEAWFEASTLDFLGANEAEHYEMCQDVLDVWFDSGASSYCVLNAREELSFPADLYLEGSDQHRGWFQTSLLTSMARCGQPPYRQVLTHGFMVDAKGHKMSKSQGNVVAPQKVIETLGADVLRLWIASADYTSEMAVSQEILQRTSDTYRRIRNTARFLLANLSGFDPKSHLISPKDMLDLDCWIVAKAKALQDEIQHDFNQYHFHAVVQKIHHFCSLELGGIYLDIIKDRQYTCQENSIARRSAQTAIYYLIESLTRWISPILSFTAEEIWQFIPGDRGESVFLEVWSEHLFDYPSHKTITLSDWDEVMAVREEVNKAIEQARSEGLGSGLAAELTLYVSPSLENVLNKLADELRFVFITGQVTVVAFDQAPESAQVTQHAALKLQVLQSLAPKCERCWHRDSRIGQDKTYPDICPRCISNISGEGEVRLYA